MGICTSEPELAGFDDLKEWINIHKDGPMVWVNTVSRRRGYYHYNAGCRGATTGTRLKYVTNRRCCPICRQSRKLPNK